MSQHVSTRLDQDQENVRNPVKRDKPVAPREVLKDVSNALKREELTHASSHASNNSLTERGTVNTKTSTARVSASHFAQPLPNANVGSKRPRSESMESALVQAKHKFDSEMDSVDEEFFSTNEEEVLLSTPHYTSLSDFRHPHGVKRSFVNRLNYVNVSPEPIYDEFGNDLSEDIDPIMCEEYCEDIYTYLYMQQEQYMVNPALLENLPHSFQWDANRHTLMNWLSSIHRKFRLVGETFYLAVNITDRFMASYKPLKLDEVQLVATTALFLASKYEEVMAPAVSNFAFVSSSTADEVREMEKKILIELGFDLGMPQPLNFLRRISKADDYQMNTRTVAKFLLEIQLFEPKLMVYRPSDIAAASMLMSRKILNINDWTRNFVHYSGGCTENDLQPIMDVLIEYLRGPCEKEDEVLVTKYASKKMLRASTIAIEWARS